MMRRAPIMPGVVRITAGQLRRLVAVAPEPAARVPPKTLQVGYTFPERGAIDTLFREARKYR